MNLIEIVFTQMYTSAISKKRKDPVMDSILSISFLETLAGISLFVLVTFFVKGLLSGFVLYTIALSSLIFISNRFILFTNKKVEDLLENNKLLSSKDVKKNERYARLFQFGIVISFLIIVTISFYVRKSK